ncbi:MAG TPA: hypothetical protein VNU72_04490 [Puia sp.]|nr:hypothetical protein [Puia sp.]
MNRCQLLTIFLLSAPLTCLAQIQVSQEPRHHNVYENNRVRILDVHIPPGDTSLMHKHSTPSVFMILSQTKTGSEVLVEPAKTNFSDGNIWFESFSEKPRIHRVWNSDTTEFHVVDMELLNKDPQPIDPPLGGNTFTLLFDETPVRGYRLLLPAGGKIRVPGRKAAIVVVGLSNTKGEVSVNKNPFTKKGDFVFVGPGGQVDLVNNGNGAESFALLELK